VARHCCCCALLSHSYSRLSPAGAAAGAATNACRPFPAGHRVMTLPLLSSLSLLLPRCPASSPPLFILLRLRLIGSAAPLYHEQWHSLRFSHRRARVPCAGDSRGLCLMLFRPRARTHAPPPLRCRSAGNGTKCFHGLRVVELATVVAVRAHALYLPARWLAGWLVCVGRGGGAGHTYRRGRRLWAGKCENVRESESVLAIQLCRHLPPPVQVPSVGRTMAEHGAEVIKVEDPKGDMWRSTRNPACSKLLVADTDVTDICFDWF
jgi:hypothetical protein